MFFDSWAWIEMFKKSPRSAKIREMMSESDIFTSVLNIAEVSDWCIRSGLEPAEFIESMKNTSNLLIIDEEIAEKAGASLQAFRKVSPGFGMVDSLIYSLAQSSQMPILTGDPHFKKMDGVLFVD